MSARRTTRRSRRAFTVTAAVTLALTLTMSGCAVDPGPDAEASFASHMSATPGVLGTEARISNTLPFSGSGSVSVILDPSAAAQTLETAAAHAMAFRPSGQVTLHGLTLKTPPTDATSSFSTWIDVGWGDPTDDAIERIVALEAVPGLVNFRDQRNTGSDGTVIQPSIEASGDECATLDAVEYAAGMSEGEVTWFYLGGEADSVLTERAAFCG